MAKAYPEIHNLESLDREIYHLQLEARKLEDQLDQNIDYLQENYGKLLRRSLFNKAASATEHSGSFRGQLFHSFMQNEKVQGVLEKVLETVGNKLAEFVDKLSSRFTSE